MVVDAGKLQLDIVLDCSKKARLIIGDLLSFSRPVTPTSQVHDPVVLLNENLPLVQKLIQSEIVLAVRIEGRPAPVEINRTSFTQILLNLAVNAVGAMNGRGELTIVLDDALAGGEELQGSGFVRLLVIDTGCGMDKATVDRAFEPFFTTKPVGQGTGLGLPVVYGLVHEMGGTIAIDSELGIGTTVTILIPRHIGDSDNGQNIDS
jgi:signal transduction histidine kinase